MSPPPYILIIIQKKAGVKKKNAIGGKKRLDKLPQVAYNKSVNSHEWQ